MTRNSTMTSSLASSACIPSALLLTVLTFNPHSQLTAEEVAEGAVTMLDTSLKVSITAMNIMPTREEKSSGC